MAETAEDISPQSLVTLDALWQNDFMPMAMGIFLFLLALANLLAATATTYWLMLVSRVLVGVVIGGLMGTVAFLAYRWPVWAQFLALMLWGYHGNLDRKSVV